MIKKLSVGETSYEGYAICGIVSHLKDYRLAYYVNKALGIRLKRFDDFSIDDKGAAFAYYYYKENRNLLIYNLISNHHPLGKFIPLQNIDYFLFLKNVVEEDQVSEIITKLRKQPDFIMVFEQDMSKVKNRDAICEAIEFHELRKVIKPDQKTKIR